MQVPRSTASRSVDEQLAFVGGPKSRTRRGQEARGGEVAGAEVKGAVASVLWAGIGMGIPALHGMRKVPAAKNMGEVLSRLHRAGEDQPQQPQGNEMCDATFHGRHYT